MNPTPRDTDEKSKKAVEEFLAKGGKITYCEPFERTEDITYTAGFYGRKKPKKEDTPK